MSRLYMTCPDCEGSGHGPYDIETWCPKCARYHREDYPVCKTCQGAKLVQASEAAIITAAQELGMAMVENVSNSDILP